MPEGVDTQEGLQHTPEARENAGLRIDFKIDNNHLIGWTLWGVEESRFSSEKNREDLIALQNYARGESERDYGYMVRKISPEQFFAQGGTMEEVTGFLAKIERSDEFEKIRQQTEAYMEGVKAEWERNYPQTSKAVEQMTGFDLNKQITVNMTHPSLRNGMYMGNDTITWGHTAEWDNYDTVYLWHEVLHSYLDRSDLSHALIQFIADNELRVRLNAGETYPPFEGHKNLFPLMEMVLPHWRSYLAEASEEGDLAEFEKKLGAMPEFQGKVQEETPNTQVIDES